MPLSEVSLWKVLDNNINTKGVLIGIVSIKTVPRKQREVVRAYTVLYSVEN